MNADRRERASSPGVCWWGACRTFESGKKKRKRPRMTRTDAYPVAWVLTRDTEPALPLPVEPLQGSPPTRGTIPRVVRCAANPGLGSSTLSELFPRLLLFVYGPAVQFFSFLKIGTAVPTDPVSVEPVIGSYPNEIFYPAPHRPCAGGSSDWKLRATSDLLACNRWSHRHGVGGDLGAGSFLSSIQSCSHRRRVGGELLSALFALPPKRDGSLTPGRRR
jgi:hypothetical protein